VGREWDELGGGGPILNDDDLYGNSSAGVRLIQTWTVAARALDDVQGAVRDCGEALARSARALTIRLCSSAVDSQSNIQRKPLSAERDAAAAAGTSLWWLMRKGLNHTCPEVIGVCLSTLVEVVGIVRPAILEPSLSTLLSSLLLAVSALEPAALNYMQLRTSDQDGLERTRLQLAQSGPLASALTKCLELVPYTKLATQQSIAPALDAVLRQSAGFATRAATADAVSTLCNSCPTVFQSAGSSTTNPSVRLLRAFYYASERERGSAAKDKMIHALGNLAALCPASSVRSLAVRACERYRFCTGNNFDPASRRAAASALRTIAVRASNVFREGGRGDVWCTLVLPVAYLGRKDSDDKIAAMWQEVWDEGGSVASIADSSSVSSFGTRLEEKLLPSLVKESVLALQDVSWERRKAGATSLYDLCEIGVLAPAPRSVHDPTKSDAAILLRAQIRANASSVALQQCILLLTKPRLWNGKSELLKAVSAIASKWSSAIASCEQVSDENSLLGLEGDESSCPWRPLIMTPGMFEDDLCVNDGWFKRAIANDDVIDEELELVLGDDKGKTNNDDRASIDFQQCDVLLKEDEEVVAPIALQMDAAHGAVTFTGLCRFMLEQAIPSVRNSTVSTVQDELLVYRTTAFRCFRDMLNSLKPSLSTLRIELYAISSPLLLEMIGSVEMIGSEFSDRNIEKRDPPVLTSGAINCIEALLWKGIGLVENQSNKSNFNPQKILALLKEVGGAKQPAWTVREAVAQCIAQVARLCDQQTIQDHYVVLHMVDSARQALADRKFWKVRYVEQKWFPTVCIFRIN
jgi:proteasome component ECM29